MNRPGRAGRKVTPGSRSPKGPGEDVGGAAALRPDWAGYASKRDGFEEHRRLQAIERTDRASDDNSDPRSPNRVSDLSPHRGAHPVPPARRHRGLWHAPVGLAPKRAARLASIATFGDARSTVPPNGGTVRRGFSAELRASRPSRPRRRPSARRRFAHRRGARSHRAEGSPWRSSGIA